MSIGGLMRTSVSGMNAQATRLSAVSENIANSNTNGYKQTTTEFASQILPSGVGQYNSGAVEANVRTLISEQGGISYTANSTNSKKVDLAISGNGFLVVNDGSTKGGASGNYLTRAGSFTQQADGSLVNAAGYTLMGYPVTTSGTAYTLNGYAGLQPVNLRASLLSATPTTKGDLTANLNKEAVAVAAADTTPGEVTTTTTAASNTVVKFTSSSSVVTYDNTGKAITLDVYYTKTDNNKWEVAVFNHADASPATGTGASTTSPFPYAGGAANAKGPLYTAVLEFDATSGKLSKITPGTGAATTVDTTARNGFLNIDLRSTNANAVTALNGSQVALNISDFTQYSKDYLPLAATVNGNPAEVVDKVSVGKDGTVTATFTSGTSRDLFKVPLAMVAAPDNLTPVSGNAYSAGVESGSILMGFGGSGGLGTLQSGALENSTVDMASELTTMIESQRSYTANSKVFQTGSEIMDVLVNLKR
ncbi:flagellar hook protein FlgE [Aureimonas sp. AU40]|uniref:flagellar hook protein FlgE n=1 Tax=Aureimonas sp. AU40 TaxID=1637747 RepID=UPI0007846EAD|nr:flagellar hook protein FlgE [Aureimonas sp. AU40]